MILKGLTKVATKIFSNINNNTNKFINLRLLKNKVAVQLEDAIKKNNKFSAEQIIEDLKEKKEEEINLLNLIKEDITRFVNKKTVILKLIKRHPNLPILKKEGLLIEEVIKHIELVEGLFKKSFFKKNDIMDVVEAEYKTLENKDYKNFLILYKKEQKLYVELDKELNPIISEETKLIKLEHKTSYLNHLLQQKWIKQIPRIAVVLLILATATLTFAAKASALEKYPSTMGKFNIKDKQIHLNIESKGQNINDDIVKSIFSAVLSKTNKINIAGDIETIAKEARKGLNDFYDNVKAPKLGKITPVNNNLTIKTIKQADGNLLVICTLTHIETGERSDMITECEESQIYDAIELIAKQLINQR